MSTRRTQALDRLRACLVALVVLHHAALAYATFAVVDPEHYLRSTAPVVDPARWRTVDPLIVFDDGFFMCLMFLLSGLFAWPSLRARGAAGFARRRLLRLGLPFAVAAGILMPLAHYPALLANGTAPGFGAYWWHSATQGPWPTGPLWFVWLLLAFDLLAAALHASGPSLRGGVEAAGAWLAHGQRSFAVLLAIALAACLPMLLAFGAERWFAAGPFIVQASRSGLYAAYFLVGLVLGAGAAGGAGSPWQAALARQAWAWLAATLAAFALFRCAIAAFGAGGAATPPAHRAAYGAALVLFGATAAHAGIASALRWSRGDGAAWRSLAANGYGIYLVHYLPVVWLQYALLASPLPAAGKCMLVFAGALAASWSLVAAMRRSAGLARLL
jgi:peptidoglycan/LPS O-acetylase OafA/YrhL